MDKSRMRIVASLATLLLFVLFLASLIGNVLPTLRAVFLLLFVIIGMITLGGELLSERKPPPPGPEEMPRHG